MRTLPIARLTLCPVDLIIPRIPLADARSPGGTEARLAFVLVGANIPTPAPSIARRKAMVVVEEPWLRVLKRRRDAVTTTSPATDGSRLEVLLAIHPPNSANIVTESGSTVRRRP